MNDDDDLPPCLGERYRDLLHDLQRAALPPETETETETEDQP